MHRDFTVCFKKIIAPINNLQSFFVVVVLTFLTLVASTVRSSGVPAPRCHAAGAGRCQTLPRSISTSPRQGSGGRCPVALLLRCTSRGTGERNLLAPGQDRKPPGEREALPSHPCRFWSGQGPPYPHAPREQSCTQPLT